MIIYNLSFFSKFQSKRNFFSKTILMFSHSKQDFGTLNHYTILCEKNQAHTKRKEAADKTSHCGSLVVVVDGKTILQNI